jgi:hypothetical protein
LQNNGGSTETHLPLNASAAIDSADNVGCPALDQRGYARPYNLVCDIGSVEAHFPEMPTPPTAVALSGPTSGEINTVYTFTASVSPISTTTPITYVWQIEGQPPVTQTNGLTNTFLASWADAGVYSMTVTAVNESNSSVSSSHQIIITADPISVPLTAVALSGPGSGDVNTVYTFTAVVTPISTTIPITYVWQISGQAAITQTNGITDTVLVSWAGAGEYSVLVTAVNASGEPVTDTHTIHIGSLEERFIYLPAILKNA